MTLPTMSSTAASDCVSRFRLMMPMYTGTGVVDGQGGELSDALSRIASGDHHAPIVGNCDYGHFIANR
jgi:hypothetical protein